MQKASAREDFGLFGLKSGSGLGKRISGCGRADAEVDCVCFIPNRMIGFHSFVQVDFYAHLRDDVGFSFEDVARQLAFGVVP